MKIYFLSLFPELICSAMNSSILGRALKSGLFCFDCVNIRDFATDTHRSVDDHPYGGGAGMVMRADILEKAMLSCFDKEGISKDNYNREECNVIVTSASGVAYKQEFAQKYSTFKVMFVVCGHYEGIDQRFIDEYADVEIRIGDYVLTGGEVPAIVITDSIIRLLPGVLGSDHSVAEESFSFADEEGLLLEYPQYTRPALFCNSVVPDVLTSGNHAAVRAWRLLKARELRLKRTQA